MVLNNIFCKVGLESVCEYVFFCCFYWGVYVYGKNLNGYVINWLWDKVIFKGIGRGGIKMIKKMGLIGWDKIKGVNCVWLSLVEV